MKNFVVNGLAGLSVLLSLTACGTEVKTEEYYRNHIDEAKAREKECDSDKYMEQYEKGELSQDQITDCANASSAVMKEELDNPGSSQGKPNPNALKW